MTNSFLQIIRSNRLAEKVISQLNLGVSPDSFLSDNLSVQSIESTPFIKISVSWGDSDTAYLINQSVIDSLTAVMNEMKISGRLVVVDGPVKPKQQKILGNTVLAGIFVLSGFCIGFLGVLFNMLLYKGFRTEEDIRGILHLENLGVIPLRKHYTV
jgi:capsular polysaccharide biosynthesis protein